MNKEDIKEKLQQAMESGEILPIIYQGGSEPGAVRNIFPRKIEGALVYAYCEKSKRVKGFSIGKIQFSDYESVNYTGEHKRPEEPKTLEQGMSLYIDEIKNIGWHIKQYEYSIELYKSYKNGKLRKTPTFIFNHDPEQALKPWITCGTSFKYFNRAVEKFINEASQYLTSSN
jgi:hypothetical protein